MTKRSHLILSVFAVLVLAAAACQVETVPYSTGNPPVGLSQPGSAPVGSVGQGGIDADDDGIPDAEDQCANQSETPNGVFDGDGCPDTFQDLINFAAQDINQYWQTTFASLHSRYDPPTDIVPYTRSINTPCGPAVRNNAFYCSRSHAIYYDATFLERMLQANGDFAPVTILAHEWGHLVQADLGIFENNSYTIQLELQADCLAGAYARHANEENILDEGDLAEGAQNLYDAGDPLGIPWFDDQAHGQPQQRVQSFQRGVQQGASPCLQ